MAYKQKPAPFKQEKGLSENLKVAIEKNTKKNQFLKEVESSAKKDSVSAAKDRLLSGGNMKQAGRQGNLAANKTRQLNNAWDLTVERGSSYEGDLPRSDAYNRRKPTVEKDVKMARNAEGFLDVAKEKKKTPPAKQMETIKKIASKVKEGVKKVGEIVGYRDTSGDDSRYGDKIKKTPPVKQLKKRPVAKMKKC